MLVAVCAKLAEPTKWEASGRGNPSLSEQGEFYFLIALNFTTGSYFSAVLECDIGKAQFGTLKFTAFLVCSSLPTKSQLQACREGQIAD